MAATSMHESTRRYVGDERIACGYDAHFAGLALFDYDCQVLKRWFDQPGRLIDLGCGTGRHLVALARSGFDVLGVDLSPHMLCQARTKLRREKLSGRLLRADFCNLPIGSPDNAKCLAPASFDYAICMFSTLGMIYGRQNRCEFLRTVSSLLKPAGRLALHVHNYGHNLWHHEGRVFLLTNLVKSYLGRAELGDKILSHYRGIRGMYIHVFRKAEIVALLRQAGFSVTEVLALNRRRNGALKSGFLGGVRANGFLILAQPAK